MDLSNSERGEISSITAVDLRKAFDSVDHDVLLTKLGWYGIDPTWLRSYLSGRKQLVRGGEAVLPVRFGVPQGSMAGSILFSLFTNDLHCHLPDCRVIAYADDTQLLGQWPLTARPTKSSIVEKKNDLNIHRNHCNAGLALTLSKGIRKR